MIYPPGLPALDQGIVLPARRASAVVHEPEVEEPRDVEHTLDDTRNFVSFRRRIRVLRWLSLPEFCPSIDCS